MLFKNKTRVSPRQRTTLPRLLTEREQLIARCQHKWLKTLEAEHGDMLVFRWDGPSYEWLTPDLWRFVRFIALHKCDLHVDHGDGWRAVPTFKRHTNFDLRSYLGEVTDWREILTHLKLWRLKPMVANTVYVGKRSSIIWKIGMTMYEAGASRDQVKIVLRASRCWQDKHGLDERKLEKLVNRIYSVQLNRGRHGH